MKTTEYQNLVYEFAPQLPNTSEPEPVLSDIILKYYASSGMSMQQAQRCTDQYLRHLYREFVRKEP